MPTPPRYQVLKAAAHREICEWMRVLDWKETLDADQLGHVACSYFRNRHRLVPRFKRAKKPSNKRQMITRPREGRRMAILMMARRDIVKNNTLFPTTRHHP